MILSISPKTGRGNHSVQLRKIEDGTLIRQFDLITHQKLAVDSFTPRNRDPEIFLSSSIASNRYEMFLLNVSNPKPDLEVHYIPLPLAFTNIIFKLQILDFCLVACQDSKF